MKPQAILLVLLLLIAIVLRIQLVVTVAWMLLGLIMLARAWSARTARTLRISRQYTDRAFAGDRVPVRLLVMNLSRLPIPWIAVSESVPLDLQGEPLRTQVDSISSRGTMTIAYTLLCRRRGFYHLGPVHLQFGDVLGARQRLGRSDELRPVIVYPRVVPLERLTLPTRSVQLALPSRSMATEDPSRLMGVRDYSPGDSPRRIHWGATARTGKLEVKLFQHAIARETLIFLNMNARAYDNARFDSAEMAVIVAASLANHMVVNEHLPVGLATEGRDAGTDEPWRAVLPPRSEESHLMSILEVLARIESTPGGGFTELLRTEGRALPWGATMVIITGPVDDELAATSLYLKRSGHAVAIIAVEPPGRVRAPRGNAGGIPIYPVWTDTDLVALQ